MHAFDHRFLKFNGHYNYTDWDVVRGVPWSTEWHKHFPREFHEIVMTLLLCRVSAAASGASGLGKIPNECLLMIVPYLRQ